jgi:ribose/xylose/arabinose/galactoside ABC-type transport system permease subunit
VRYAVQPIIATLILFIAGRGIAQLLSGGQLIGFRDPSFQFLGLGRIAGVPMPVVLMVAIAGALWFVVRYTAYGRTLLATGGNPAAARLAGVRTGRVRMAAYVTCSSASSSSASRARPTPTTSASGWSWTPSPPSPCPARRSPAAGSP